MLREKARRPLDLTDTKQNLGKFTTAEGYATRLPMWPQVSIVGLFLSGRCMLLNHKKF